MATRMGSECSFKQIMRKLEVRFGARELTETAKIKFQQSSQRADESYDDWADRVLTLATPAFRDLPERHCRLEAISKFCLGSLDKEAGKYACLEKPRSMEEAINRIKQFQHITMAIDGKKRRRDEVQINAIDITQQKAGDESLKETVEKLLSRIESLEAGIPPPRQAPQVSDSNLRCYFCRQMGHRKTNCEKYRKWLRSKVDGGGEKDQKPLNG